MRVTRYDDPQEFSAAAMEILLRDEAANNLIIGLLARLTYPADAMLCTVADGDQVVAAGLMTPGRPMALSEAPAQAIQALVEELAKEGVSLPGVIGKNHVADEFAVRWTRRMKLKTRPAMTLGVHQLDRVTWPTRAPGRFRQATPQDVDVTADLIDAFAKAIHEPMAQDPHDKAREGIEQGRIYLWEDDGRVVSIAAWNRRLMSGIAIGLVYTPPDLRGRGYASNCVASLSQHMLDSGWKFCCLFTDLANPTSNKIYRDMGYRMICENKHVFFD
jgi:uncharacterized protein